jgi:N-methylhydantoinase B
MGGGNGTANYVLLLRDGKELMRVNRITNFQLKKDDVVSIRSGGGGGWGDPRERDPVLVRRDVLNGYITAKEAQKVYGVS